MKTTFNLLVVIFGFSALLAHADEGAANSAPKEKSFTGTIQTLDAKERAVKVKRFLFTKSFHLGQSCEIAVGDKNVATLGELRPGQKVEVHYKDASGVLVASRVAQQPMVWHGRVESISADKRYLVVKDGKEMKKFAWTDESRVVLSGDKSGKFDDVRIGHRVAVVYELPGEQPVARRVEQTSETFTGSLSAIDAQERTLKAKHLRGEKKFRLASDCQIFVNGRPGGALSDLRLERRFTFSYDEVDGINVVNRIASADLEPSATKTASAVN
jgi:hypothetical protein